MICEVLSQSAEKHISVVEETNLVLHESQNHTSGLRRVLHATHLGLDPQLLEPTGPKHRLDDFEDIEALGGRKEFRERVRGGGELHVALEGDGEVAQGRQTGQDVEDRAWSPWEDGEVSFEGFECAHVRIEGVVRGEEDAVYDREGAGGLGGHVEVAKGHREALHCCGIVEESVPAELGDFKTRELRPAGEDPVEVKR